MLLSLVSRKKFYRTAGQLGEASSLLDCPPIVLVRSDKGKLLNLLARRQSQFLRRTRREKIRDAHLSHTYIHIHKDEHMPDWNVE